jgi:hypothetical protein
VTTRDPFRFQTLAEKRASNPVAMKWASWTNPTTITDKVIDEVTDKGPIMSPPR